MKGKPTGMIATDEICEQRRQRMTGPNNPMWTGGDSDRERRNSAYKNWRVSVFKRDDFRCQTCGYRNGDGTKRTDLHAHHVEPWVTNTELRYVPDNGLTVCVPCHRWVHALHTDG
jgi:5-methylcytosine-specific restriction endonuclease McrA